MHKRENVFLSKLVLSVEILWVILVSIGTEAVLFEYDTKHLKDEVFTIDEIKGFASSSIRLTVKENNKEYLIQGDSKDILNYKRLKRIRENEKVTLYYYLEETLFDRINRTFGNVRLAGVYDMQGEVILNKDEVIKRSKGNAGIFVYLILGWGSVLPILIGWIIYFYAKSQDEEHLLDHPLVRYKIAQNDEPIP